MLMIQRWVLPCLVTRTHPLIMMLAVFRTFLMRANYTVTRLSRLLRFIWVPVHKKFHKTSFKMVKTFRDLSNVWWWGTSLPAGSGRRLASHTLFGFTLQHRHGEDTIQIGWNRDVDIGCYVKHKSVVHPLKTNYTLDTGAIATTIVPTEHQ